MAESRAPGSRCVGDVLFVWLSASAHLSVSPPRGLGGRVRCTLGSKRETASEMAKDVQLNLQAQWRQEHVMTGRVSFTLSGQESYELQIEERYNYVPSAVAACIPPGSQVGKNLLRKVRLENRRVDVHPSHDEVHWTLTSKVCRQGLPTGSKHGMGVVRISTALLEAMLSERSTVLTNFLAQSSNVVADAQLSYSSHLRGASLAVVGDGSRSLQLSMASGSLNASCSSHSSTQPRVLFAGSLRGIKAHNVTSLAWRQHGALHIAPALPPDGGGLKIESVSVERPGVPISQRALQTYTTELFTKFLPDINEELGKFAFVLPRSLAQFVRCKSAEQSGQPVCGNFALRQLKGMQGYLEFTDFESDPVMLASRKDPFTGSFKVALLGLAILAWHLLAEGFGKAWLLSFMSFALLLLLFAAWGPGGPGMWSWHGPFADFSVANFQHFGLQRPESVVSKLQEHFGKEEGRFEDELFEESRFEDELFEEGGCCREEEEPMVEDPIDDQPKDVEKEFAVQKELAPGSGSASAAAKAGPGPSSAMRRTLAVVPADLEAARAPRGASLQLASVLADRSAEGKPAGKDGKGGKRGKPGKAGERGKGGMVRLPLRPQRAGQRQVCVWWLGVCRWAVLSVWLWESPSLRRCRRSGSCSMAGPGSCGQGCHGGAMPQLGKLHHACTMRYIRARRA
ncbi:unnamed protein product [Effrenium voratum]|uniref:Uncharacterized protein n=1 Tax=Effrenium voratum TaxID=2562239 RepID=A0AA36I1Z6_9DINO|nr:unnamed protein product [Effrenium voratum]